MSVHKCDIHKVSNVWMLLHLDFIYTKFSVHSNPV